VRTFASSSFFRLIYGLLGEAHSDLRRTKWEHRGVNWIRERHTFNGGASGFVIDQYLLTKPNPNGWTLLVVKEMFWDGNDTHPFHSMGQTPLGKPLKNVGMVPWGRTSDFRAIPSFASDRMMEVPERDLVSVASAVEEAVDRSKSTHRLLLDRLMRGRLSEIFC
jgi:hypothetical protein